MGGGLAEGEVEDAGCPIGRHCAAVEEEQVVDNEIDRDRIGDEDDGRAAVVMLKEGPPSGDHGREVVGEEDALGGCGVAEEGQVIVAGEFGEILGAQDVESRRLTEQAAEEGVAEVFVSEPLHGFARRARRRSRRPGGDHSASLAARSSCSAVERRCK